MEKGKDVCKELKAIRQQIADANGIKYSPKECTHKGDCAGTCPACEAEVKYLEKELNLRSMLGKAAVVAGLSIVVSSCTGCDENVYRLEGDVPYVDTIENLCGEVAEDSVIIEENEPQPANANTDEAEDTDESSDADESEDSE